MVYNITADSVPVYKAWFWSTDAWDCIDWQNWRIALGTKYTADEADYIWSKAWLNGVSEVSGGTGSAVGSGLINDSVPLSCRTFNSDFKAFLSKYPNLNGAVFSGLGGLIAKPLSLGTTLIDATGKVITNAADTVTNTSSVVKWVVPVLVVVAAILLIFWAIKKFDIKFKVA